MAARKPRGRAALGEPVSHLDRHPSGKHRPVAAYPGHGGQVETDRTVASPVRRSRPKRRTR